MDSPLHTLAPSDLSASEPLDGIVHGGVHDPMHDLGITDVGEFKHGGAPAFAKAHGSVLAFASPQQAQPHAQPHAHAHRSDGAAGVQDERTRFSATRLWFDWICRTYNTHASTFEFARRMSERTGLEPIQWSVIVVVFLLILWGNGFGLPEIAQFIGYVPAIYGSVYFLRAAHRLVATTTTGRASGAGANLSPNQLRASLFELATMLTAAQFWIKYWVCLAAFMCIENMLTKMLNALPLYYMLRILVTTAMCLPISRVADPAYDYVVGPLICKYAPAIERVGQAFDAPPPSRSAARRGWLRLLQPRQSKQTTDSSTIGQATGHAGGPIATSGPDGHMIDTVHAVHAVHDDQVGQTDNLGHAEQIAEVSAAEGIAEVSELSAAEAAIDNDDDMESQSSHVNATLAQAPSASHSSPSASHPSPSASHSRHRPTSSRSSHARTERSSRRR